MFDKWRTTIVIGIIFNKIVDEMTGFGRAPGASPGGPETQPGEEEAEEA